MAQKLLVKTGQYESNGEAKNRWQNIGVLMETEKGPYLLLDPTVNLAAVLTLQNMNAHKNGGKVGERVMVSVFEEDQQQRPQAATRPNSHTSSAGVQPNDEDIPF